MQWFKLRGLTYFAAVAAVGIAAPVRAASTVAITEFLADPYGTDETAPEWIELFNYGTGPVDVTGWKLQDNSSSVYTLPAYTIPSGGYAIASHQHDNFVTRWLGGVNDSRVFTTDTNFSLNNSSPGDGLTLKDSTGALVYEVGYNLATGVAYPAYRATFLTGNSFSITDYGPPPQNGAALINLAGTDGTGTLGYEANNATSDAFAYASPAGNGAQEFGSPLLGQYTVVTPEPASLSLAAAAAGVLALRRRQLPVG